MLWLYNTFFHFNEWKKRRKEKRWKFFVAVMIIIIIIMIFLSFLFLFLSIAFYFPLALCFDIAFSVTAPSIHCRLHLAIHFHTFDFSRHATTTFDDWTVIVCKPTYSHYMGMMREGTKFLLFLFICWQHTNPGKDDYSEKSHIHGAHTHAQYAFVPRKITTERTNVVLMEIRGIEATTWHEMAKVMWEILSWAHSTGCVLCGSNQCIIIIVLISSQYLFFSSLFDTVATFVKALCHKELHFIHWLVLP